MSDTGALPAKAENLTYGETHVKRHHMQFTCVTCNLPVKTDKSSCFYAASTSRRIHAIARHKARKSRVTSLIGCRLTFLQFAGEFTRGELADSLQLQIILCAIAGIFFAIMRVFLPEFAVIFGCVWWVISPAILKFLPANWMYFCLQKKALLHARRGQVCMSLACKISCKILVIFK